MGPLKRVANQTSFTFFGPLACLAAALGPLAAELGPLACFKSYWFLFIIINSVLCVFRFINL